MGIKMLVLSLTGQCNFACRYCYAAEHERSMMSPETALAAVISPNCCVIRDNKPCFLTVSELVRHSAARTRELLRRELQIRLDEQLELLFFASLERWFIQERVYKDKQFEQGKDMDAVLAHIRTRLEPFADRLPRPATDEDLLRLMEIRMKRILKFSTDEADRLGAVNSPERGILPAVRDTLRR